MSIQGRRRDGPECRQVYTSDLLLDARLSGVLGDRRAERNEVLFVKLSRARNAAIPASRATVTIVDDDRRR